MKKISNNLKGEEEKTFLGRESTEVITEKKYDYFGEINPKVNENEICAEKLGILLKIFNLKVIGENYRSLYLDGVGRIDLTFKDYCKDVADTKSWLRTAINNI